MKVLVAGLAVFAAGVGGALLATASGVAVPGQYSTLVGLVWLAVLATLGIRSSIAALIAGIAFDLRAGTQMVPINYRANGDAMKDLLGGHVQAWFAPIPSVLESVRTGQFVAIATTGPDRSTWLSEVPTIAESRRTRQT